MSSLDSIKPFYSLLPQVANPDKHLGFKEKIIIWSKSNSYRSIRTIKISTCRKLWFNTYFGYRSNSNCFNCDAIVSWGKTD